MLANVAIDTLVVHVRTAVLSGHAVLTSHAQRAVLIVHVRNAVLSDHAVLTGHAKRAVLVVHVGGHFVLNHVAVDTILVLPVALRGRLLGGRLLLLLRLLLSLLLVHLSVEHGSFGSHVLLSLSLGLRGLGVVVRVEVVQVVLSLEHVVVTVGFGMAVDVPHLVVETILLSLVGVLTMHVWLLLLHVAGTVGGVRHWLAVPTTEVWVHLASVLLMLMLHMAILLLSTHIVML